MAGKQKEERQLGRTLEAEKPTRSRLADQAHIHILPSLSLGGKHNMYAGSKKVDAQVSGNEEVRRLLGG